jgi:hypothetical protein
MMNDGRGGGVWRDALMISHILYKQKSNAEEDRTLGARAIDV